MRSPLLLTTPRLVLHPTTVESSAAAARGDTAVFGRLLDCVVPAEWPPPIMADAQQPMAEWLARDPQIGGWAFWYAVRRDTRTLVGGAGFKGRPAAGRVDIGYAILDAHQRQGFASEAVAALLDWAFSHAEVQRVVGETFPDLAVSIRVMEKFGFVLVSNNTRGHEGEEGVVQYELRRELRTPGNR